VIEDTDGFSSFSLNEIIEQFNYSQFCNTETKITRIQFTVQQIQQPTIKELNWLTYKAIHTSLAARAGGGVSISGKVRRTQWTITPRNDICLRVSYLPDYQYSLSTVSRNVYLSQLYSTSFPYQRNVKPPQRRIPAKNFWVQSHGLNVFYKRNLRLNRQPLCWPAYIRNEARTWLRQGARRAYDGGKRRS
jgi:hypothetical protein